MESILGQSNLLRFGNVAGGIIRPLYRHPKYRICAVLSRYPTPPPDSFWFVIRFVERLAKQLAEAIDQVEHNIAPYRKAVLASTFGPTLRRHLKELQQARQTYGPVRMSKA
ncbi:MAG: hypothetical protein HZB34_06440 [Nitrospirae bacterium]|nr:hypothetical protein [Nitrospirota bacterium]